MKKSALIIGAIFGLSMMVPLMTFDVDAEQYDHNITSQAVYTGWSVQRVYSYPDNMVAMGWYTSPPMGAGVGAWNLSSTNPYYVARAFMSFDLGFFDEEIIDFATLSIWTNDWADNSQNITVGAYISSAAYQEGFEWTMIGERIGTLVNTSELYPYDADDRTWPYRELSMAIPGEYLRNANGGFLTIAFVAEPEVYTGLEDGEFANLWLDIIPSSAIPPILQVHSYDEENIGQWTYHAIPVGGWTFGTAGWVNSDGTWPVYDTGSAIPAAVPSAFADNLNGVSKLYSGVTTEIDRVWVTFDAHLLPDDAVVTGSNLTIDVTGSTFGNPFNLTVYRVPTITSDITDDVTLLGTSVEFLGILAYIDSGYYYEPGVVMELALNTSELKDNITLMFCNGNEFTGGAPIDGTEELFTLLASTMYLDIDYFSAPTSDAPVADAGPNQFIPLTATVDFDGSTSTDDFSIENYTWSFTYDGTTVNLYGVSPSYDFDIAGVYNVTLTVTDEHDNTDTDIVAILVYSSSNVEEEVPDEDEETGGGGGNLVFILIAQFTYDVDGNTVSFTDTSIGPKDVVSWYWNFGDGEKSTIQNPTHRYDSVGSYTITMTAVDSDGVSSSITQVILVQEVSASSTTISTTSLAFVGIGLVLIIAAVMVRIPIVIITAGLLGVILLILGILSMFGYVAWM